MAFAYLNIGSVVATLIIGRLMDRVNAYRLLSFAFLFAFLLLVAIFGVMANNIFHNGCGVGRDYRCFFGSNSGLMALATISYPVSIRTSGVGWAYAMGKVGSMFGPVVGGFLLGRNWSVGRLLYREWLIGAAGSHSDTGSGTTFEDERPRAWISSELSASGEERRSLGQRSESSISRQRSAFSRQSPVFGSAA